MNNSDKENQQQVAIESESTATTESISPRKKSKSSGTRASMSPQKPQRGDRLDNLVDSLSHIYYTDNETRSHKLPPKYDNMIVGEMGRASGRAESTEADSDEKKGAKLVPDEVDMAPRKKRWSMVASLSEHGLTARNRTPKKPEMSESASSLRPRAGRKSLGGPVELAKASRLDDEASPRKSIKKTNKRKSIVPSNQIDEENEKTPTKPFQLPEGAV